MAQQKIFKSRLSAKDLMKFSGMSEKGSKGGGGAVSSSPRWQYYHGTGSQRIVVHQNERSQLMQLGDRKHVTRVSINANYPCYQSRSLSDLRLLPDVTSSVNV